MAIVTLTINPALDISTSVAELVPEVKLRCEAERVEPGGGGINAARTITSLGGEVLALHCSGAETGQRLCVLLDEAGVEHRAIPVAWRTRESFAVTERCTERIFKFILPGPAVSGHEIEAIEAAVAGAIGPGDYVLASGSLPIGAPDDMYGRIAAIAADAGARLMVDAHGPALAGALGPKLFMIKPNWREFDTLVGRRRPLEDPARHESALELVAAGRAEVVVVTEAERGAFVATARGSFAIRPPAVEVISPIGGGDAFAGAALLALSRGEPIAEACRLGAAAAAAAMGTVGTEPPAREDVERILAGVELRELS
ncbi:MAG: hexose kinase [Solirubrobacterales bacterium]